MNLGATPNYFDGADDFRLGSTPAVCNRLFHFDTCPNLHRYLPCGASTVPMALRAGLARPLKFGPSRAARYGAINSWNIAFQFPGALFTMSAR